MQITLTWQTILSAAAVVSALGVLLGVLIRAVRWMDNQKQQDLEIQKLREVHAADTGSLKQEQTLIIYGLLACLKGLKEQGCNGPVTEAIQKIEAHLNRKAHS